MRSSASRTLAIAATAACFVLTVARGEEPPQIVRLRVPSERVKTFFPAGTEFRVMPSAEFEALVEAATRKADSRERPVILRARHEARLDRDRLLGRSELSWNESGGPDGVVTLDPWTPAIENTGGTGALIKVTPDGRLGLSTMGTGPRTASIVWEQCARPETEGRTFDLGLPATATCRFVLDLPEGLEPEIAGTIRQGPAMGASADRRTWRFDGHGGLWHLRLRASGTVEQTGSTTWISGSARVDASELPARWTLDMSVDPGPSGPKRFGLELDAGLDLIDVAGAGVASYRADPLPAGGTSVSIRMSDSVAGPSEVTVRALCRVIPDGPWRVPAYRTRGAVWTGGRTVVRLAPGLVASGIRATGARQVDPTGAEREFGRARSGSILAFESSAPGSPAEISLTRSPIVASADVRGQVILSHLEAPRLEARISWRVDRGRLPSLSADLPAGWSPEKAQIQGVVETTAWHAESRPGGGSRIVIHTPPGIDSGGAIVLDLTATAFPGDRPKELELPRVTPVAARIGDEIWTLRADPGVAVVPRQARGLAWLDPSTLDPIKTLAARLFASKSVLAWRWTAGDGRAIVAVGSSAPEASVEAWTVATIRGERLTLEYCLSIEARERPPTDLNVVFLGDASASPVRWEVAADPVREVEATPIAPDARERLNLPANGSAWRIVLPRGRRNRVILRGRVERPWASSGIVPLLALPDGELSRGTLLVFADRSVAVRTEAPDLSSRNAAMTGAVYRQLTGPAVEGDGGQPSPRPIQAFAYSASSHAPTIRAEPLPPAAMGGVVEEACLTSHPSNDGRTLHRLVLHIVPGPDRVVEVTLPPTATAERMEVEGRPTVPTRVAGNLRFLLPMASSARPTVELAIDYWNAKPRAEMLATPDMPRVSLPCLAFSWGLQLPADLAVTTTHGGLARAEALGGPKSRPTASDRTAVRELDERCHLFPPDGLTLAAWLIRLDGGHVPIVVDRPALYNAGLGPRTLLAASRDRARTSLATEVFASLGLSISVRGGVVIVGAGASANDPSEDAALRAAANGHDGTDRLQSVARWRGEATPRATGDRPRDGKVHLQTGGPTVHFAASGLPSPRAGVELVNPATNAKIAFGIALAVALLATIPRRLSPRLRWAGLAVILGTGFACEFLGEGIAHAVGHGLVWGGCAAIGISVGAVMRLRTRAARRGSPRTRSGRARTAITVAVVLIASFSQAPARQVPETVPEKPGGAAAIFAILPYDPPFNPSEAPTQVVLRLSDHALLRTRADALTAPRTGDAYLTSALHEVVRQGTRDALVTSTLELRTDGQASGSWPIPIAGCRDLSATLNGRDAPVRITPGGMIGEVDLPAQGMHRLIVHRLAAVVRSDEGEAVRVPIPPMATARLRAYELPDGPPVEAPTSRGRCSSRDGVLEGVLGPISDLELRWPDRAINGPPPPRGIGEATVLWDVEPSGDRVRLKMTARPREPLVRLTLGLAPGLLVRSVDRPGAADATQYAVASGTVWTMPLSPPLAAGQSVTVELWRSLGEGPSPVSRSLPRFEMWGAWSFSGLVGVRLPENWSGRLGPGDGGEPVPDELFARAWGPFPDASSTFAGAARFVGVPELTLRAGPSHERSLIRPSVTLDLSPGRLDVRAEAALGEQGGRPRELEATIPADLRISRVEAQGLTTWSRPAADRLRLRFDGEPSTTPRTIHIGGWVPIDADPMATGTSRFEAEVPWPVWNDAEVTAGTLEIAAPSQLAFRLEPRAGVLPAASPAGPAGTSRSGFVVPPGSAPGRLRWTSEENGVTVRVQSLLTLHPESAEWIASARYAVPWGPCPPIKLRLSRDWAEAATVEIDGVPIVPEVDAKGVDRVWSLRPERPAWGGARVVIRATLSRRGIAPLAFPDLVPLGRPQVDRADSYLAYADASGAATGIERSTELQPVDSSKWDADDLSWPPGTTRNVFRVVKEGWSLRFRAPAKHRPTSEGAAVSVAELQCSLSEDGSLLGRASYDLDGQPASQLILTLPSSAEALTSTVDGAVVVPRHDGSGRIVIMLPDAPAARVVVTWRAKFDTTGSQTLPVPRLDGQVVPTILTVDASERSRFAPSAGTVAISPADGKRLSAESRAGFLASQIPSFDRGSPRDRAALLAALVRFELQARSATRAAVLTESTANLSSLQRSRRALEEALSAQDLGDFAESAAARVGRVETDPLSTQPVVFEPPTPLRLRPIGTTFTFRDESGSPVLRWTLRPVDRRPIEPLLWPAASVLLAVSASAFGPGRPRRATLAIALAGGFAVMGPGIGLAGILTLLGGVVVGLIRG